MLIQSTRNPKVRAARRLRERKHRAETGCFLLDTPHLIAEGLAAGLRWREAFYDPDRVDGRARHLLERLAAAGARLWPATADVLAAICPADTPQGIVAVAELPAPGDLDRVWARRFPAVVALDGVQDPLNVGAILRAARAFGAGAALLGAGTADPFHPRALRASAGAVLHTVLVEGDLPAALRRAREQGFAVLGLDPHQGMPPEALAGTARYVLVVGSEGRGLSEPVRACADTFVRVPMREGVESLNAAVAAAIALYVLERGRIGEAAGGPAVPPAPPRSPGQGRR